MADQSARTPPKKSLEAIDRAMLTPLVRRALRSENCEITDWAYHFLLDLADEARTLLDAVG